MAGVDTDAYAEPDVDTDGNGNSGQSFFVKEQCGNFFSPKFTFWSISNAFVRTALLQITVLNAFHQIGLS